MSYSNSIPCVPENQGSCCGRKDKDVMQNRLCKNPKIEVQYQCKLMGHFILVLLTEEAQKQPPTSDQKHTYNIKRGSQKQDFLEKWLISGWGWRQILSSEKAKKSRRSTRVSSKELRKLPMAGHEKGEQLQNGTRFFFGLMKII